MEYYEFKNQYVQKKEESKKKYDELKKQIYEKRKQIEKLEKEIFNLIEEQNKIKKPSWIDYLVKPIAEHFAKEFKTNYEINGPFGIHGITQIYWKKPNGEYYELTIIPHDLKNGELSIKTEEKIVEKLFSNFTIKVMNPSNTKIISLPGSFDEIKKLIKHNKS